MTLTPEEIRQILTLLQNSDWDQAEVVVGDVAISVTRNGVGWPRAAASGSMAAPPAVPGAEVVETPPPGPSAPPVPAVTPASPTAAGHVVTSPSVGLFWRSPQPGAPPFVEVGQRVDVGDVLGIVEIMKLMNQVVCDVAGTVAAIHVANAAPVEYGEALMTIAC